MVVHAAVPGCWTLIKLDVFHRNIVIWLFDWLSGCNTVILIMDWIYIARFKAPKALHVSPLFILTTFTQYHLIITLNRVTQPSWCESRSLWFTVWSAASSFKTPVTTLAQSTILIPRCPWPGPLCRSSCLVFYKQPPASPVAVQWSGSLRGCTHGGRSLRQRFASVRAANTARLHLITLSAILCLSVAWLMDWAQWKQRALRIHLGSWQFFMYGL